MRSLIFAACIVCLASVAIAKDVIRDRNGVKIGTIERNAFGDDVVRDKLGVKQYTIQKEDKSDGRKK